MFTCGTFCTGMQKRERYDVKVVTLEQALQDCHTMIKMDIEGAEMAILVEPRREHEWRQARLLVFEYSVARCCGSASGSANGILLLPLLVLLLIIINLIIVIIFHCSE